MADADLLLKRAVLVERVAEDGGGVQLGTYRELITRDPHFMEKMDELTELVRLTIEESKVSHPSFSTRLAS